MGQGLILERDTQLTALRAAVEAVKAGESSLHVVSGPPGTGKTRLLDVVREWATDSGLRVLVARCTGLEREYSFGLVRQLLEPSLLSASTFDRSRWFSGAATSALPIFDDTGEGGTGVGEFAVLHGLFWLTANICDDGPAVLILDDLQWADEPSLRYLAYLVPRLIDSPLLIVAGVRPNEPGVARHLVDIIMADPACRVLHLASLSSEATSVWLGHIFGDACEATFSDACYRATGGNPLLLSELVRALKYAQIEPSGVNAERVVQIGSQAVVRHVSLSLSGLKTNSVRAAEAVAALGFDANLVNIAWLSRTTIEDVNESVRELEDAHLVRANLSDGATPVYDFEHPLVQAAVYEQIPARRRVEYHTEAAQLLRGQGARLDKIASHLLRVPPSGDAQVPILLREAASDALRRGAPEAASTYLRRCLMETWDDAARLPILRQAGIASFRFDIPAAAENLQAALDLAVDPADKARLASLLGLALVQLGRAAEAVTITQNVMAGLKPEHDDLRRGLEALLIDIGLINSGWDQLFQKVPTLRELPSGDGIGSRMLDCMIATYDAWRADPRSLDRVRLAVAQPGARKSAGEGALMILFGCMALVFGNPDDGIAAFDAVAQESRKSGSLAALFYANLYRGVGWLRRGDLSEAETDLREALQLQRIIGFDVGAPVVYPHLSEVLVERGLVKEAESALQEAGIPDPLPPAALLMWYQLANSRVLYSKGRFDTALAAALDAGERFATVGGDNPAILSWRSEAALCLHALDRDDEARKYAEAELELARSWGAPFALGRALRVAALLTAGNRRTSMLQDAIRVLQASSARLEHAKTLVELGATLGRYKARVEARDYLTQGLELALQCGADALVELARTELRAAGARTRSLELTGPRSLTPSELRVAELALRDLTNRQIAQQLFVTTKTVEIHLSSVYRKLGITRRRELSDHLNAQPAASV